MILVFSSCQNNFDGYTNVEDGIHLKLLSFDDISKAYSKDDYIKLSLEVKDGDEIIFQHFKYLPFLPLESDFDKVLMQLHSGDSVEILIEKAAFNNNSFGFSSYGVKSEHILVNIKIHDFLAKEDYGRFLETKDDELIEQQILKQFLKKKKDIEQVGGVYVERLNDSNGEQVAKGDLITIQYTGSFINGLVFDMPNEKQPFEFVYGSPGQVVEGLDMVLKILKNGEKAKIIIPSHFAFGEEGSSTGIVPPYSTVIYNLEIKNIKQK